MKKAQTRHVFSNTGEQWIITAVVFVILYAFFMWYHAVRGKPYSWFTTEKCVAIASVFCLGFALALGPLSRFAAAFRNALPYRRSFGLLAAYCTIMHVLLCVLYLPRKFPDKFTLAWFTSHWLTTVMGVVGLVLFLTIAVSSYPSNVKRLGKRKWMILQKFSYLLALMVVVHLLSLGKAPGWIKWLQTFDKPLPPGAFTTTVFCVLVLLLKAVDLIVHGDSLVGETQEDGPDDEAE